MDVHIDDPVAGNASMRTRLPSLYYYILFWEGPSFSQVARHSTLLCFCSSSADTC